MWIARRVGVWLLGAVLLSANAASGQTYPTKLIRIVTAQPGGASDLAARLIAQALPASLGQPMIVDNRGTESSAETVAKATPDGHTLLVVAGTLWVGSLIRKPPYNPVTDFSPVSLMVNAPLFLVVHPSLPVRSVQELIALAKARPGELNCALGTRGSTPHLAAELFKAMAAVNIVGVGYKGSGPAIHSLIGGEVQLMFATSGSIAQHVKAGRLKMLAVTSVRPSALAPGVPTVSLPGYEAGNPTALFAPAKTPAFIVTRLNREIVNLLNQPEVKDTFLRVGAESIASTPEQLGTS